MHVGGDIPAHPLAPLTIRSLNWDYSVEFVLDVRHAAELAAQGKDLVVVCDAEVAGLYAEQLSVLSSTCPTYVVPATEETKSLAGVQHLVDWLIAQRAVRSSTIVAIGGGCIQDLVSFTAHVYYRGIAWVFLPTTVLSQSDSCIGAKSGINVLPFKNQLGTLHPPRRIIVAAPFIDTLPSIEVASGYGEIVKLAVTSSRHFLPLLEDAMADDGIRTPRLLELTRASLAVKQEIIEQDEYETDLRRILNYGHSFGHALEALAGHQVPHGLGVLWGIDVINWLGVRWGITDPGVAARLSALIRGYFDYTLPITPSADHLVDMLGRDKKVVSGVINFAVLQGEGTFRIVPIPLDATLTRQVAEYLDTDYVFRRP